MHPCLFVGPASHNTNRAALVTGPKIALTPPNTRLGRERDTTIRDEVLAALGRIRARTGTDTVSRRELVTEVLSSGETYQQQSVHKALRRMSGRESGAGCVDLEDLG